MLGRLAEQSRPRALRLRALRLRAPPPSPSPTHARTHARARAHLPRQPLAWAHGVARALHAFPEHAASFKVWPCGAFHPGADGLGPGARRRQRAPDGLALRNAWPTRLHAIWGAQVDARRHHMHAHAMVRHRLIRNAETWHAPARTPYTCTCNAEGSRGTLRGGCHGTPRRARWCRNCARTTRAATAAPEPNDQR